MAVFRSGIVAFALVLLGGCHMSYHVREAERREAIGDPAMALAHYQAALEEVRGDSRQLEQIRAARALAAVPFARLVVSEVLAALPGIQADAAIVRLVRLRATLDDWKAGAQIEQEVTAALAKVAAAAWHEVEELQAASRHEQAAQRAVWLTQYLSAGDPLRAKADGVRAKAAQRHQDLAAQAPPGARLQHLTLASHYGAPVAFDPATRDALAAESDIAWKPTAGGSCLAEAQEALSHVRASLGRPVTVDLKLTRCKPEEQTTQAQESFVYTTIEEYQSLEQVTDNNSCRLERSKCTYEAYSVYNAATHTSDVHSRETGCETNYVCDKKWVYVTKRREVPHNGTRHITNVRYTYSLSGEALVRWDDNQVSVPVDVGHTLRGSSYTSEVGDKALDKDVTPANARSIAIDRVWGYIADQGKAIQANRAQKEKTKAVAAMQSGQVLLAEHHYAVAERMTGELDAAAIQHYAEHYLIPQEDVVGALAGRALAARQVTGRVFLPAPDPAVAAQVAELAPVQDGGHHPAEELDMWSGSALSGYVNKSPFSHLYYLTGARLDMRHHFGEDLDKGVLQFTGNVASRMLGGEGRGWGAGIAYRSILKPHDPKDGDMLIGLHYDEQSSPTGVVYRNLSYQTGVRYLGPYFSVDLLADWNMLAIGDWAGVKGSDKHWTPISAGLSLYPGRRFILRGTATWYLGQPDGIHFGASLGVRL